MEEDEQEDDWLIRQCIGHEVFHHVAQETSVMIYGSSWRRCTRRRHLGTKPYLMRRLVNLKLQRARGRTVRCFYCDQEGHIKRDCTKYKAQDQSSDTAVTVVMAVDENEFDHARDVYGWRTTRLAGYWQRVGPVSAWQTGRSVTLTEWMILRVSKGNKEMLWGKKTRGLIPIGGMSRQGELLSDMGPMVLVRRMDKESNRCTEVLKASAGVPGGSVVVQERREMLWDIEGRRRRSESLCSRFDQWRCSLQFVAQGRRDRATTTRKVMYFATHPGGGVVRLGGGGGAGHLGEKVQALRCGGAYTFGGKWSSPLMRLRYLGCCLAVLWGAGSEVVRKNNLKTSDYPPVGLKGELLIQPIWMSPSPVAKPKPDWSSYGVSM
ncbi:hypothetical protein Acr_00g0005730 [Actinidia rufa]|uniref:CCHC-type domain-containing protein n=1 Tax=Actinidia rufa TaxID=165716 RepID=A0A7J0D9M6_9ERIC|nr:hypothetical protein Acr_00g0005730 [Actinidia rufa]